MTAEEKAKTRWGTQPGSGEFPKYDRRRFYIDSTNEHNHYDNIRPWHRADAEEMGLPKTIKIPYGLISKIKAYVDDPLTEYRSIQDFIRDAIYHRLHDIAEMKKDNDFLPIFNRFIYKQTLNRIKRVDQEFSEEMEYFNEQVQAYVHERNPHGIADILEEMKSLQPLERHYKKWRDYVREWEDLLEKVKHFQ